MMEVMPLQIPDVKVVYLEMHQDERGHFVEAWNRRDFGKAGIDADFVQDNQSCSIADRTIRGLHFQKPPKAQAKLVRVIQGKILDVAVDIRPKSKTYGKYAWFTLSPDMFNHLFIPVGFAHGFVTLEPKTIVTYKVSEYYSPEHDAGIVWNDSTIGIDWPLEGKTPILSEKDSRLPRFEEATQGIEWDR